MYINTENVFVYKFRINIFNVVRHLNHVICKYDAISVRNLIYLKRDWFSRRSCTYEPNHQFERLIMLKHRILLNNLEHYILSTCTFITQIKHFSNWIICEWINFQISYFQLSINITMFLYYESRKQTIMVPWFKIICSSCF